MSLETPAINPPIEKWREEIDKKLKIYLGKSVKLIGSTITLEKGEYGISTSIEGILEKKSP